MPPAKPLDQNDFAAQGGSRATSFAFRVLFGGNSPRGK